MSAQGDAFKNVLALLPRELADGLQQLLFAHGIRPDDTLCLPATLSFLTSEYQRDSFKRWEKELAGAVSRLQGLAASPEIKRGFQFIQILESAASLGKEWAIIGLIIGLALVGSTAWLIHTVDGVEEHSRVCIASERFSQSISDKARQAHKAQAQAFLSQGWKPSDC